MSLIGRKLLQFRRPQNVSKKHKPHELNYERSKHFGLLYTWESTAKMEAIEKLSEQLIQDQKTVSVLCFNPLKNPIDSIHDSFGMDSLNNFGKLKSEVTERFLKSNFDYQILLDFEFSEITSYLTAHSNALYKVGRSNPAFAADLDLMLEVNANADFQTYIDQILKYIKIIKYD